MRIYDRLMNSGLVSRRRMLVAASVGLIPVTIRSQSNGASEEKAVSEGSAEDYRQIEQLLYRYAIALDNRDASAWAECWIHERRGMTNDVMTFHRQYERTMHNVINHLYTIKGMSAVGSAYCVVSYVKNTDGKQTKFDTYSRYADELVKRDDRWMFSDRKWVPIFSDQESPVITETVEGWFARQRKPD